VPEEAPAKIASLFSIYHQRRRLTYAIIIGLALGIASGFWLNARLAAVSSAHSLAAATDLPPGPQATAQTLPAPPAAIANPPGDADDTSLTAVKASVLPASDEPASADTQRTRAAKAEGEISRRTQTARADTATSVARAEKASAKVARLIGAASDVETPLTTERVPGRGGRCAFAASKNALTLRSGGTDMITLRISEPTAPTRVSVSTPNWADIVLLPESQTPGSSSVLKYSIRSVSQRAGTYKVNVKTPCGAKTITVNVTQP
jgi:hypothetical protein